MKVLAPDNREALFAHLAEAVSRIENNGPLGRDWQLNYFGRHRNRYSNDLDIIAEYYKGGQVADIGSFPFHETFLLKSAGIPVVGIDLRPERNAEFIHQTGLEIHACDIETQPMPMNDNSVQLVLLHETFEHLRINPIHALREIHRVMTPEARFILTTPNLYSLRNIVRFLRGRGTLDPVGEFGKLETMGHMGHIREYAKKEMHRFLASAGFRVIEHRFVHHQKGWGGINGIRRPFYFILLPFRPWQVLICEKNRGLSTKSFSNRPRTGLSDGTEL